MTYYENMQTIKKNIQRVHKQIYIAAKNCGRDAQHITLLAVSKSKPVTTIEPTITVGQRAFGENYAQEGVEKIRWFRKYFKHLDLIWHFIGPVQANKSRLVAENFDWCHTLASPQIAKRLNDQRPTYLMPINTLIQININNEDNKAGIMPKNMFSLAEYIVAECPNLELRGLMAIPAPEKNFQRQLATYNKMHNLYESLKLVYSNVDTLSLGMTNDMSAAITAGSTMVRIGTAIFGARE